MFPWLAASLTAQRDVSLHSQKQSCIQHGLQISPGETFRFIGDLSKINVVWQNKLATERSQDRQAIILQTKHNMNLCYPNSTKPIQFQTPLLPPVMQYNPLCDWKQGKTN